jgi:hypothetical protein
MDENAAPSAPSERYAMPPRKLHVILRGAIEPSALFFG